MPARENAEMESTFRRNESCAWLQSRLLHRPDSFFSQSRVSASSSPCGGGGAWSASRIYPSSSGSFLRAMPSSAVSSSRVWRRTGSARIRRGAPFGRMIAAIADQAERVSVIMRKRGPESVRGLPSCHSRSPNRVRRCSSGLQRGLRATGALFLRRRQSAKLPRQLGRWPLHPHRLRDRRGARPRAGDSGHGFLRAAVSMVASFLNSPSISARLTACWVFTALSFAVNRAW